MGARNVAMVVQEADGLLSYLWSPTHWQETWGAVLEKAPEEFLVAPTVVACIGDDMDACRDRARPRIALHIGGMGPRTTNFYASLVARYGYASEVAQIQELDLSGDRKAACAAVPDTRVDDLALVGPVSKVADQLTPLARQPDHDADRGTHRPGDDGRPRQRLVDLLDRRAAPPR